jgi:hypothetical protein
MKRFTHLILIVSMIALSACTAASPVTAVPAVTIPEPTPTAPPAPTVAAVANAPTTAPAESEKPTSSPFPTPAEVAPEETFRQVGSVAHLSGTHGVAGKAIVAGLQTLIIQGFTYDGKGSQADIRLVQGEDVDDPAHILIELEERAYEGEFLLFHIPSSLERGSADRIVVYSRADGEMYGVGIFE